MQKIVYPMEIKTNTPITILIPSEKKFLPFENIFANDFFEQKPLKAFDGISIDFLSNLSTNILNEKNISNYAELVALAYWIRKSNTTKIINSFLSTVKENEILVPRGVAFHIAPSNVDSIFLYSWTLSLLAGNINVVRISQNISEQMELLLNILSNFLSNDKWQSISNRNFVITYSKDEFYNHFFSSKSNLRILWGGDETVKLIKSIPAKPATLDISFVDKFSFAVINSKIFNEQNENKKNELAKAFYNDAYWFDQLACSSPKVIYFIGNENENAIASKNFWSNLESELKNKKHFDNISIAMNKLNQAYDSYIKIDNIRSTKLKYDSPSVLQVHKSDIQIFRENCGSGFFYECFLNDLSELINLTKENDQTITYFGFDKKELTKIILSINGKGIDRVVPIGQALEFNTNWDGYSLFNELTKRVFIS